MSTDDFKSIRQIVYQRIRSQILSGEMAPGIKLVEAEVAATFGVSRTPLREAFRELESEGLIVYTRHQGVRVAGMKLKDMEEIYEIRMVLEGLATRLAAMRRTNEEIGQLMDGPILDMERAFREGRIRDIPVIHTAFNRLLYGMAHNGRLQEILQNYHEYTERSQMVSLTRSGRGEAIMREHREMAEAILRQDVDAAQAAAEVHVQNARLAFLEYSSDGLFEAASDDATETEQTADEEDGSAWSSGTH